ncbi:MAG: acyl carrier protein [Acidobacteriia bacterium]|nr:acyl carrier protein [Terriglobia bacterium]
MTRIEFQNAVEDLFKVPHGSLKPSDSRDTVEGWESFTDVDLLNLIEKEFGIEAESEILERETFGDLLKLLESRGAFGGESAASGS